VRTAERMSLVAGRVRHGAISRDVAPVAVGALDLILVVALAAVSLAIDLVRLGETSIWGDEAFSIGLISNSWPEFWRYVWTTEANMVLYHAVLKGWLDLTGAVGVAPLELVVRLPSVIFAALATVVVFWIGRRFWGPLVGALGAALLLLNHVELLVAREARSYSLQVLLISLGWYLLLVALTATQHRRRWWTLYASVMTLAIYAHLFSGLVVASQVVAFGALLVLPTGWREPARRSFRAMAASIAAVFVAIVPLIVFTASHGPSNVHIPPSSPYELARVLWNISGHSVVYGLLLAGATIAGALLTLRAHRRGSGWRELPLGPAIAIGCWLLVPFTLAYAASQPRVNLHLFAWGYLVVVVPALCILAGIGVSSLRAPLARAAMAVSLVVAAAFAIPASTFAPAQDFRVAAAWIAERYEPGDGLVCTSWSCALAMDYYARSGRLPASLLENSPARWSWTLGRARPLVAPSLEPYAADRSRVFLMESLLGGDTDAVKAGARAAEEWLDGRYRLLSDVAVPSSLGPVRVRLYETGTP
jgi:mannosyltransferase